MTLREEERENENEPRAGEPQTPAHGENHQTDRSARSAGSDQSVGATLAPAPIVMTQEAVQSLLAGSQSRLSHKDCEVVLYRDISQALPQMAKDADFSKRMRWLDDVKEIVKSNSSGVRLIDVNKRICCAPAGKDWSIQSERSMRFFTIEQIFLSL